MGTCGKLSPVEYEAVRHFGLFEDLTVEEVQRLLRGASSRIYPRSTLLFTQGDPADRFYLVLEGRVKLVKTTEAGGEGIVDVFTPGSSFGEAAMFASRRFPVGAEVLADAKLVHVAADSFLAELARSPETAFKLLATLSRHHRRLLRQLGELRLKSPGQRLASYLLSLADGAAGGRVVVELPMDKGVVAGRVGITPESFSRALIRLRDSGVHCRGREVVIEDIQALRAFCQEADGAALPVGTRPCGSSSPSPGLSG
ncbi:MAG: Crp/Fnr family transcriptional regulator [Alphaproteobacteria bacterium]|nr:Crp/Fnr family transcriptional regulator [Alphaproteobacteria bacterium]